MKNTFSFLAKWTIAAPTIAMVALVLLWSGSENFGWLRDLLIFIALLAAILASVHHAEVVAHKVGEPFGTLILSIAITVIEVGLIGSILISGGAQAGALVRDTVFATVMIVLNGVVGLCLLAGALRHHVIAFRIEGASHALTVLIPLTILTLVLPSYTTSTAGPFYSVAQSIFVALTSLVLYGTYVFVQTVRHRDYFLPVGDQTRDSHALPPSSKVAWTSFLLLVLSLTAVIGLAKLLAPAIAHTVRAFSLPNALIGIVIAILVLMPEAAASVRAARLNRMQTSLNLALGSALATIGLTIPAAIAFSMIIGLPLKLGLPAKETLMLMLSLMLATLTLATGRSTVLHGAVHLVLFATYLFLTAIP